MLTLLAAFPFKRLSEQLLHADLNQALAERYIIVLLKTDPGNAGLRLTLIRQLIRNGQFNKAEAWLDTVRPGDRGTDYEIARLDLQLTRIRQLPQSDPSARLTILKALNQLATAKVSDSPQRLGELGDMAVALHDDDLALRFYERLARTDSGLDSRALAKKGDYLLGLGRYRLAAELYFLAQGSALSADARLQFLLRGVRTLQAGGRLKEAVAEGERRGTEFLQQREYLIFMIRLALAANDPAAADRFSRLLLRYSWLEKIKLAAMPQFRLAALSGDAPAQLKADPAALPRTFDDEAYTLAWQAFLANRNLKDAWRVAVSATQQRPDSLIWHERLAQISEWTQRPREALESWLWLARKTNSAQAWQGVLRLAPGLFDYNALLEAYRHEADGGHGNTALWQRMADTYEYIGDARTGLDYLERIYARQRDPDLLPIIARLAQRLGDTERALRALKDLRRQGRGNESTALTEAVLHYSAGHLEAAYEALTSLPNPSTTAVEYWQVRAELARLLGRKEEAVEAYRVLQRQGMPRLQDTQNLVAILASEHPLEAAQVAEAGWRRSKDASLYLQALSLYAQVQGWHPVGLMLGEARGDVFDSLRDRPTFWRIKAAWAEHEGDWRQAREAWETTLRLAPEENDVKVALLWLLIQQKDRAALTQYLRRWREEARHDSQLAGVFSAAHVQLGQFEEALKWAQSQLQNHRQDFLWLMNYADLLDLNHRQEWAQRLRLALWAQRQQVAPGLADKTVRTAVVRLALLYLPGDRAESVLLHALREAGDENVPPELQPVAERGSENANELALGYFLSQEATDRATAWLLARHARRVATPAWARSLHALQSGDKEAQARLLDEDEATPLYDRISAARDTGRVPLAQTLAFEGLDRFDWDDQLHLQLSETVLPPTPTVAVGGEVRDDGNIATTALKLKFNTPLKPRWSLGFALEQGVDRTISPDTVLLRNQLVDGLNAGYGLNARYDQVRLDTLFKASSESQVELGYRQDDSMSALKLGGRCHFDCYPTASLMHTTRFHRLDVEVRGEWNQLSTESTQLRMLGKKDDLQTRLQWNFSRREYVNATLRYDRFGLEGGENLGDGKGLIAEAGYHIRTEYPDFTFRVNYSQWRYSAVNRQIPLTALPLSMASWLSLAHIDPALGTPLTAAQLENINFPASALVPQSYSAYGVNFGFGANLRRDYTRAWRPYLDLGLGNNSVTGLSWNGLAGIAGSVFGQDHLTAYVGGAQGGQASAGRTLEAGLYYTYFLY